MKFSDLEYIEGLRDGDRKALMSLYEKLRLGFEASRHLFRNVLEEERIDVFQDSFIILWENIEHGALYLENGRICACRAGVRREVPDLTAYFMRIVRNKYRELLRRNGKLPIFAADEYDIPDTVAEDTAAARHLMICDSFMELPERCRQILTMFYYDGMSLEEILESLGREGTYNGLKTRKHKCMQALKDRILLRFRESGLDV